MPGESLLLYMIKLTLSDPTIMITILAFNEWNDSERGRTERFWTASRDVRLLEWIEKHPTESKIIFSKVSNWRNAHRDKNGHLMTKKSCYKRAAQSIFSEDDPAVRRQLINNGGQLGDLIGRQLLRSISI